MSGRSASSVGSGRWCSPARSARSVPAARGRSGAAIQAEALDLRGHRGRDEIVDRQPGRDPLANLGGRDGQRCDREQLDPSGRESEAITPPRSARSVPGRVAAPIRASSSTRSGRTQVGKAASSSAPSRKRGSSSPSASSESTVRAKGSRETSATSIEANASSASCSRSSGSCRHPCGPDPRRHGRAGARAESARPPPARARRARCGVDRMRRRGSRSCRSLPDHDLVADLDLCSSV